MITDNPSKQNGTKFQTLVRCIEGELKRRNRDLRYPKNPIRVLLPELQERKNPEKIHGYRE